MVLTLVDWKQGLKLAQDSITLVGRMIPIRTGYRHSNNRILIPSTQDSFIVYSNHQNRIQI